MLRSGFFNSQNHDRMYNVTDFNELISTIKSDGIDNYGDKLEVSAGQGLSVQVSTGKCFFNNNWLYNDNAYQIELEEASIVAPRIDAIVVEVNDTERDVFLKSVSGEPSNNPVPPTLIDSGSVHQHLLAYVNVPKEATSVGTITDKRSEWADIKSDKLDDIQDQITRNIENEEVASRTYNPGEYIVRYGVYYRVTNTIAIGTSFVIGSNIETTDVGNEITEINNNLSQLMQWKFLKSENAGTDISISSLNANNCTEICVFVNVSNNVLVFNIPYFWLANFTRFFRQGSYDFATSNSGATIKASTRVIGVNSVYYNTTSQMSSCTFDVYYR